jgi:hypothetical protein
MCFWLRRFCDFASNILNVLAGKQLVCYYTSGRYWWPIVPIMAPHLCVASRELRLTLSCCEAVLPRCFTTFSVPCKTPTTGALSPSQWGLRREITVAGSVTAVEFFGKIFHELAKISSEDCFLNLLPRTCIGQLMIKFLARLLAKSCALLKT